MLPPKFVSSRLIRESVKAWGKKKENKEKKNIVLSRNWNVAC